MALNLSEDVEFGIFDQADELELTDDRGSLYAILLGPDRQVLILGTLRQQVAKFTDSGPHWHGFHTGGSTGTSPPPHPPERALPKVARCRRWLTRGCSPGKNEGVC